MQFSGCYVQVASGAIWLTNGLTGKPYTTMAPATRFDQWKTDGTFERINLALNQINRERVGKKAFPSILCIDSQSRSADAVKLSPMIVEDRGMDTHQRVNGRKRQLVVDTQGRLWAAHVHAANQADGPASILLIKVILWAAGERLEKVYGDQAYNGVFAQALAEWSRFAGAIDFEKASRPESSLGFVPVAKRSGGWSSRSAGAERLPGRISFRSAGAGVWSKITSIPYHLRSTGCI